MLTVGHNKLNMLLGGPGTCIMTAVLLLCQLRVPKDELLDFHAGECKHIIMGLLREEEGTL